MNNMGRTWRSREVGAARDSKKRSTWREALFGGGSDRQKRKQIPCSPTSMTQVVYPTKVLKLPLDDVLNILETSWGSKFMRMIASYPPPLHPHLNVTLPSICVSISICHETACVFFSTACISPFSYCCQCVPVCNWTFIVINSKFCYLILILSHSIILAGRLRKCPKLWCLAIIQDFSGSWWERPNKAEYH